MSDTKIKSSPRYQFKILLFEFKVLRDSIHTELRIGMLPYVVAAPGICASPNVVLLNAQHTANFARLRSALIGPLCRRTRPASRESRADSI
jgi:hypothetical protein